MAYFNPYVNEQGLHLPSYNDVKSKLIDEAKSIFGNDMYLENDSHDYQFICMIASKIHDMYMSVQLSYNNRSPITAQGIALDSIVKLNGIRRKSMIASTCNILIEGVPNTTIKKGIVSDIYNKNWILEDELIIPNDGQLFTIATCVEAGHDIKISELNAIVTPTQGFISVINISDSAGQRLEKDHELRARQSISTSKPSRTVLEGTIGAIAEIDGVLRYKVYENDTSIKDFNGIPGHSISAIVEGGNDLEIATEIYLRKTPGCGTYGELTVTIPLKNEFGDKDGIDIKFFRPKYKGVFVNVQIKIFTGYLDDMEESIKIKISEYINSLDIGENLTISALFSVIMEVTPKLTSPLYSIKTVNIGFNQEEKYMQDLEIFFNEASKIYLENIKIDII